jgi:hypothetical protein
MPWTPSDRQGTRRGHRDDPRIPEPRSLAEAAGAFDTPVSRPGARATQ